MIEIKGKKLKSIKPTKNNLKKFDLIVIGTDHSDIPYYDLLNLKKYILDPFGRLPKSKYIISF